MVRSYKVDCRAVHRSKGRERNVLVLLFSSYFLAVLKSLDLSKSGGLFAAKKLLFLTAGS